LNPRMSRNPQDTHVTEPRMRKAKQHRIVGYASPGERRLGSNAVHGTFTFGRNVFVNFEHCGGKLQLSGYNIPSTVWSAPKSSCLMLGTGYWSSDTPRRPLDMI